MSGCRSYNENGGKSTKDLASNYADRTTRDYRISNHPSYNDLHGNMIGEIPLHDNKYKATARTPSVPLARVAKAASHHVSQVSGVALAYVIDLNHNAYVALTLDATGLGTKGVGGHSAREQRDTNVSDPSKLSEQRVDQPVPQIVNPSSQTSSEAHSEHLSHEFKQTVATAVREQLPAVRHVYISANADFFNHISALSMKVYPQESLESYTDSLKQIINRYMQ
ncbi:YhcN/YlaJ family sporulation lipoprotein [Paenibacillus taiwanensis]|uniref:YhcN/YlaJ family sporulation lipoprotein n=1 Tax=Paenibacillus taiwanensis TaxID=401638 RepID=UPI0012F8917F|nr:YhcN/YlaJ family sporulation lipoprotein [Paenibacillus taiwanensis]